MGFLLRMQLAWHEARCAPATPLKLRAPAAEGVPLGGGEGGSMILGGGECGTVPGAHGGSGVRVHVHVLRRRDRLRSATLHARRGRMVRALPPARVAALHRPRVAALPPTVRRLPSRRDPVVRGLTLGVAAQRGSVLRVTRP